MRTRVKTPGQNGSRERGFGTLKYERLYLDEIDDAIVLAERAEDYRIEYNELRPHEAISWNRPKEVHLGLADPTIPTFHSKEILPTIAAINQNWTSQDSPKWSLLIRGRHGAIYCIIVP